MTRAIALLVLASSAGLCQLRLGIIGTDTSHAVVFTRMLNDPADPEHVPGARVVAAFKGGSPDIPASWSRVDKYAQELRAKWNVEMVPDIRTLCARVDAVLLETNDGRKHLAQAREVIAAGKRVFIDKPLASTLEDAREIARLAREAGVPWFSSSSHRFDDMTAALKFPDITGAVVWGPGPLEEHHHLELSWYAIHPIERLFTLMGPGCETAAWTSTAGADEIVGRWKDGRIGSVRALRPQGENGAVVFRPKAVAQSDPQTMKRSYAPMLREVVKFLAGGKPPVSDRETLEIFAFMDAAQRSKAAGGGPVPLR